jgi:membrane protease YdiL (CAAX protease family)
MLKNFLGAKRWSELFQEFRQSGTDVAHHPISWRGVGAALAISLVPLGISWLEKVSGTPSSSLTTLSFGICAVLAFVLRSRYRLSNSLPYDWGKAIRLTHTAFAAGCVPVVIILALYPSLLAERLDLVGAAVSSGSGQSEALPAIHSAVLFVLLASLWVAIVEEVIFRGLLVSVLRRCNALSTQYHRDFLACIVSGVLFGISHIPTWGLTSGIGLLGMGIGLSLGYIANREKLFPLIFYHFLFDALSMGVLLLLSIHR